MRALITLVLLMLSAPVLAFQGMGPGPGVKGYGGGADVVLGITAASGIEDGPSANGEIRISRVQASASGSVSVFYFYHNGEGNWIGVIYSDNAGEPGTLLAKTASTAGSGWFWGWNSTGAALNSTLNIQSGSWYWHGFQAASSNFGYYRSGEVEARAYTTTFDSPPSTWPTSTDSDITSPNSGVVSYAD